MSIYISTPTQRRIRRWDMHKENSEGYSAYWYGIVSNPYEQESDAFKEWRSGWYQAEADDVFDRDEER